jgi:eukaryotic-like serine/threonine-protein kinase
MIDRTISHYTILEKLGEGGMGVVFKAHDTKLDRIVALKFLPSHLTATEEDKQRFIREAKAAAALNHTNICTIHSIDEHAGQQFISMEYIDGTTLREKIETRDQKSEVGGQKLIIPSTDHRSLTTVFDYALQIAEALSEAHHQGIVHRDIKPDNIMVDSKNRIKVMDFGLAKLRGSLHVTKTGSTVGTVAYMSPEQVQGQEIDHRSDIFSFGVVLYELLTGRLPFRGEHEAALFYSILNEEPDPLTNYIPDASGELLHIINTALEKNPEDRYQSAGEIVRDLRRLKKKSSAEVRTIPVENGGSAVRSSRTVTAVNGSGDDTKQTLRMRKLYVVISAIIVLAAAVIFSPFIFKSKSPSLFTSSSFTRITSTGNIISTAISPEGRYIAFVQRDRGRRSLWVRQRVTVSDIQILPPLNGSIEDLTFSIDGNYLYYTLRQINESVSTLYRLPVLGGTPVRILGDVQSRISFSPDDKHYAFHRVIPATGDFAIFIAAADGSQERMLATHKGDMWYYGSPGWSPDGSIIASGRGSWEGGFHHALVGVRVSDGSEFPIGQHRWWDITNVVWTSDGKEIIVEAAALGAPNKQLWFVEYPSGNVRRITNDLNDYMSLTTTSDSKIICTVPVETQLQLHYIDGENRNQIQRLTSGRDDGASGLSIAPDGTIFYISSASGEAEIWKIKRGDSNPVRLTTGLRLGRSISVAPDGQYVVFTSTRSGSPAIWRINPDGSNLKQLTSGGEEYNPRITPDGKWVFLSSWVRGPETIMKVGIDGGEMYAVSPGYGRSPVISPDGKTLAYITIDEKRNNLSVIRVISTDDGTILREVDLPAGMPPFSSMQWRPGSDESSFILTIDDVSNIWTQSLDDGIARQYTNLTDLSIRNFDWMPDGRSLVGSRGSVTGDVVLISDE